MAGLSPARIVPCPAHVIEALTLMTLGFVPLLLSKSGFGEAGRPADRPDFNPLTPRGVRRGFRRRSPRCNYFNPLTPRGVRLANGLCASMAPIFQSTHPAGGETECTSPRFVPKWNFNPLTPRGVRHNPRSGNPRPAYFNPLTPRGVRHGLAAQP